MKIIVVVVGLALAPIQVCAECAWVLWVAGTDGSSTDAAPWNSYKSLQECKQDQQGPAMKKILSENERKGLRLLPVCLPDTVDSRGAKGK